MPQETPVSVRIPWIDTLRTISIFSVVLVHTGRISQALIPYVASVYMPVFFFISGLFIKESIRDQKFLDFAKGRIQRLIIPYLTFGVISYAFWFFIIAKVKGEPLPEKPFLHFLVNTVYGVGGYGWLDYNITLWFFPCLFVVELLFFFLIRLPSRKLLVATLFLLSIIGYFYFQWFSIETFRLPDGIDISLTGVVFYGIGYLVRPYIFDDAFKGWYSPLCLALALPIYLISSNLNHGSAFLIGNFGRNYFYFYLAALSGILFWSQFSRLMKPNRLFEEIGKNTLVIFPLHLLLFPFFTGVLIYLFRVPKTIVDSSQVVGLLYAVVAILLLLPVAWGLNSYTPFLLGRVPQKKR